MSTVERSPNRPFDKLRAISKPSTAELRSSRVKTQMAPMPKAAKRERSSGRRPCEHLLLPFPVQLQSA